MRKGTLLLTLTFYLFATSALAQKLTPEQEARVQRIDSQVFSPFCPGRLLEDCPSSLAKDLRDKIRGQVLAGESDAEIIASLTERFGENLLAAPRAEGAVGWLAWLAPGGFLLVGIIALVSWVRASRSKLDEPVASGKAEQADPEVERTIREQMR